MQQQNIEDVSEEFKAELMEQGVIAQNEYINSAINKVERGDKDAFKSLYATISLYKES